MHSHVNHALAVETYVFAGLEIDLTLIAISVSGGIVGLFGISLFALAFLFLRQIDGDRGFLRVGIWSIATYARASTSGETEGMRWPVFVPSFNR